MSEVDRVAIAALNELSELRNELIYAGKLPEADRISAQIKQISLRISRGKSDG